MQTSNKVLDDIAKVMTGAAGAAQGVRDEVDGHMRNLLERLLRDLDLVTRDYITVARARGESAWSIVRRELLPNATGVLLVEFGVRAGYAPILIGSLGFLGFGVQLRQAVITANPPPAARGRTGRGALTTSPILTTMAVTLSGPPRWLARSMFDLSSFTVTPVTRLPPSSIAAFTIPSTSSSAEATLCWPTMASRRSVPNCSRSPLNASVIPSVYMITISPTDSSTS